MNYTIAVRSNMCDSYVEVVETCCLQDAINVFCENHPEYKVISEAVCDANGLNYYGVPALYAIDRDGESWWEYTMILWSE